MTLLKTLGIELPIIQAPMAGGPDSAELAAAVSNAGGLGSVGCGYLSPSQIEVTAFHPLGTCRVGADPETSVLGPDHEVNGVERLYDADGSAVPTALGVNPQMTIMAMALRAGEIIDARLG